MRSRRLYAFTFLISSDGLQSISVRVWHTTQDRFDSSRFLKNVVQFQKLSFRDEHARTQGLPWCLFVSATMVSDRLTLYIELEPETRDALRGPVPERCSGDPWNHTRGAVHVVIAGPVLIDVCGRRDQFHPETKSHSEHESNRFVDPPDRGFRQNPHDQADGFYE
jgi:hypothetical protein